jgi:hypothetical protein
MEEDNDLFIRIEGSSEVRKELLGCSKDVLSTLQDFERINELRKKKIEQVLTLKQTLLEIKKLNSLLKEKLPSKNMRVKQGKSKKTTLIVKKEEKKDTHQIKQLEEELNEIELRLNDMTI